MSAPTPHADLVRLQALAGEWVGEEHMRPNKYDPSGSTFASRITMAVGSNGFVLTCDTIQHQGDQLTFAGHGVFWHDAEGGQLNLHTWDLFGAAPDVFQGGWEGDRLVLVCKNAMGYWRYGFTIAADGNRYVQTMDCGDDGQTWTPVSEGTYIRSGDGCA